MPYSNHPVHHRRGVPASGRTIVSVDERRRTWERRVRSWIASLDAILKGDSEALKALYAQDAVAETPDQGTITGRDQIAAYFREFVAAFPDNAWEERYKHEAGDTAIDEGYIVGTNTGSRRGRTARPFPRRAGVCARECDIATVENGVVTATGSTSTCRTG